MSLTLCLSLPVYLSFSLHVCLSICLCVCRSASIIHLSLPPLSLSVSHAHTLCLSPSFFLILFNLFYRYFDSLPLAFGYAFLYHILTFYPAYFTYQCFTKPSLFFHMLYIIAGVSYCIQKGKLVITQFIFLTSRGIILEDKKTKKDVSVVVGVFLLLLLGFFRRTPFLVFIFCCSKHCHQHHDGTHPVSGFRFRMMKDQRD